MNLLRRDDEPPPGDPHFGGRIEQLFEPAVVKDFKATLAKVDAVADNLKILTDRLVSLLDRWEPKA